MSTINLKNKLKEKIDNLNEEYLLVELLQIIDLETHKNKELKIPEEHKVDLDISITEMDTGRTLPHEEVIQELKNDFTN